MSNDSLIAAIERAADEAARRGIERLERACRERDATAHVSIAAKDSTTISESVNGAIVRLSSWGRLGLKGSRR